VYLHSMRQYISRNRKWVFALALITAAVIGIAVFSGGNDGQRSASATSTASVVTTASVRDLSAQQEVIPVIGTVRASRESDLVAQTPGTVSAVPVRVGQQVRAGQLVVSLANDRERAQLEQARARLASARAQLEKAISGTREEQLRVRELEFANARKQLIDAREQAINGYSNQFSRVQDAIYNGVDRFFDNPRGVARLTIPKRGINNLDEQRDDVEDILDEWRRQVARVNDDSAADIESRLSELRGELLVVKRFVDRMQELVTRDDVDVSDTDQSAIAGASTAVDTALDSITSTLSTLSDRRNAVDVAEQRLAEAESGSRPEDIAQAQASLAEARAGVASAEAALADTFVRAPVSGRIARVAVQVGDTVSQFESVASLRSAGGLEVETAVAPSERDAIAAGSRAVIEGEIAGRVSAVDETIAADTQKVGVTIAVASQTDALLPGQAVNADITRVTSDEQPIVPLTAVQIQPDRTVVFTVTEDGTLSAVPVSLGRVRGQSVVVTDGLSLDEQIVVDARGIRAGQAVRARVQ
jgi:HlyD family secretion protein